MFIRTGRLFLRPIFPEDARALYAAIADEKIVRMLARAPWPYTVGDAQAFCTGAGSADGLLFAITLPALPGAPLIGTIALDRQGDRHELGYWIGRAWQGQGYAAEAVAGVLEIAAMLGIRRIEAGHFLDNPASAAVLRGAGFAETGELRPVASLGRGGELALARRYQRRLPVAAAAMAPPDSQAMA